MRQSHAKTIEGPKGSLRRRHSEVEAETAWSPVDRL